MIIPDSARQTLARTCRRGGQILEKGVSVGCQKVVTGSANCTLSHYLTKNENISICQLLWIIIIYSFLYKPDSICFSRFSFFFFFFYSSRLSKKTWCYSLQYLILKTGFTCRRGPTRFSIQICGAVFRLYHFHLTPSGNTYRYL